MVVRKMKEKCKDAARMRREKERAEFVELSKLLPLPSSTTSQLDKASIIRLTSSYLRMRAAFPQGLGENWGNDRLANLRVAHQQPAQQHYSSVTAMGQPQAHHQRHHHTQQAQQHQYQQIRELGSLILQTLDGFVFALHKDGKIMYISETASVHLGLPQIDLTGSSVYDYVHPSDHNDISDILSLSEADKAQLSTAPSTSDCEELGRSFCMRMKCILPKRNAGLVSGGYKAIHCNGYLKVKRKRAPACVSLGPSEPAANCSSSSSSHQTETDGWESYALVAVGHSLLPTASTEVKLTGNSFMFRANLDLKLYYVEAPVIKLLGFEQIEMIGQSLYQFVHLSDIQELEGAHRSLLEKGQVVTKYYRLMKKTGGYVWIQSSATLINNPRNMPKPQHIVSICFVLGENQLDQSRVLHERNQCQVSTSCTSGNNGTAAIAKQLAITPMAAVGVDSCKRSIAHSKSQQSSQKAPSSRKEKLWPTKKARKVKPCSSGNSATTVTAATSAAMKPASCPVRVESGLEAPVEAVTEQCLKLQHYQCTCLSGTTNLGGRNLTFIGAARRSSDDSCSIVSSVASTSVSSASSRLSVDFSAFGAANDSYGPVHEPINTPLTSHLYALEGSPVKLVAADMEHAATSLLYDDSFVATAQHHHHQQHHHPQQHQQANMTVTGRIPQQPVQPDESFEHQQRWISQATSHNQLKEPHARGTTDEMALFCQTDCNPANNHFHSSSDWLVSAQTHGSRHPALVSQGRHQSVIDYYCADDRQINHSDTSPTVLHYHHHQFPSHMGASDAIHYKQVQSNGCYSVPSLSNIQ